MISAILNAIKDFSVSIGICHNYLSSTAMFMRWGVAQSFLVLLRMCFSQHSSWVTILPYRTCFPFFVSPSHYQALPLAEFYIMSLPQHTSWVFVINPTAAYTR